MKSGKYPAFHVVLVDDDTNLLESATMQLNAGGISNIIACADSRELVPMLAQRDGGVILMDLTMPHLTGWDLLDKIVSEYPEISIIIFSAIGDLGNAVDLMKKGAIDYLVKPAGSDRLIGAVKRAIEIQELRRQNSSLKKSLLSDTLEFPEKFSAIITQNRAMRSLFKYAETVSRGRLPVLITGETGTGKELFARAVHSVSGREGAFVPVNVAGLDDNAFSDTLFGHKKGAFTGADLPRPGLVETASGGTLFLDEIGDLRQSSQVKLLRLIQEGEYYPLGSDILKKTDARIVMATHCDLESMVKTGEFRKDLYYRLVTNRIDIPPLRDRLDDLPLLVDYFIGTAARLAEKKKPSFPPELVTLLSTYSFPGNLRELESLAVNAINRHENGTLSMGYFKEVIKTSGIESSNSKNGGKEAVTQKLSLPNQLISNGHFPTLEEAESALIVEAMKRANNNQTIAANMLGLSRTALNKRLNKNK